VIPKQGKWIEAGDWNARNVEAIKELEKSWETTFKLVQNTRQKEKEMEKDTTRPKIDLFKAGNMVYYAVSPSSATSKLQRRWIGPLKVLRKITEHTFELHDDFMESNIVAHISRMRLHAEEGNLEEFTEQRKAKVDDYILESIKEIRKMEGTPGYEVLVHWSGTKTFLDQWESFIQVWQTKQNAIQDYVQKATQTQRHMVKDAIYSDILKGREGGVVDSLSRQTQMRME
jgi:hypothetical protein